MAASEVVLSSKVWIRSVTLENAFARQDGISTDNLTTGEGRIDKSWDWTFAWLLSGNIDADNQAKAPLIQVDDECSIYDGKKIEISSDLLFSSPSDLMNSIKSSVKRSAGRKFGASLTSPGFSLASSRSPENAKKKIDKTIPNILMANASDGNLRGSNNHIEKVPHDLQALSNLHEPSVVHTLQRRYDEDMIYTSTGSHILVALNPFKFTMLYEEKVLDKYAELGTWEQSFGPVEESSGGELQALPPHVFRIADNSFRAMMNALQEDGLEGAGVGVYDPLKGESTAKAQRTRTFKSDRSTKRNVAVNQSLLVSGESGSGKTVTTKHCLRYLASLSQRNGKAASRGALARSSRPSLRNIVKAPSIRLSKSTPPLERGLSRRVSVSRGSGFSSMGSISEAQLESNRPSMDRRPSWILGSEIEVKILEANPILEAFGNARTVRNDNSSRFGKYIELFFSQKGSLIGATIETYLLEKVRLIHCEEGERNYHIFYEIMDGASEEELKEYLLDGYEKEDFKIINQSGTMDRRDGVDDQEEFDNLIESMSLLQFDPDQVRDIMRVSVACMHAFNLTFTAPSADESDLDDANPHLQKFLSLMGLERKDFHDTICFYEILVGGRDKQRRNQSKANAEKGMEAFIKSIYNAMFAYLVDTINQRISIQSSKSSEQAASIGILDIFGFESFQTNSLEQLMINYCNEALQQLFNAVVFKSMKEEYDREGIDSSFISFPDNQDALDAIDMKGTSVLSILNDMSFAPGTNDEKFVCNLYQMMDPKSNRFIANPLHQGKRMFVINHYAGPVEYSTEKWIEKNKDEVPRAMVKLLESSSNSFVKLLALVLEVEGDPNGSINGSLFSSISRKRNQKTVAKQFSSQLMKLRTKIGETTPYFVRCIKPNQQLTPDNYCHKVVLDQLKSLGVMEAVRVSRSGFSKSYTHEEFTRRYQVLLPGKVRAASDGEGASKKSMIIVNESLSMISTNISKEEREKGIQLGSNKVFLRQQLSDSLDRLRNKVIINAAVTIQTGSRVWLARNELFRRRVEFYSKKIQAQVRRNIAARRVKLMMLKLQSATLIQSQLRGSIQRKRFRQILVEKRHKEKEEEERRRQKEEANTKTREDEQKLALQTVSATIIQSQIRGAIQRKRLKRMAEGKELNKSTIEQEVNVLHVENTTERELDENRVANTHTQREEEEKRRRKEEEMTARQKLKEELAGMSGFDSSSSVDTEDNSDVVQLKQKFSEVYGGSIRHSIAKSVVRSRRLAESKRQLQNDELVLQQDSIRRSDTAPGSKGDSEEIRPNGFRLSRIFGPSRKFFDDASSLFGSSQPTTQSSEMYYTVWLPITEHGLLINITSFHGGAAFASYRKKPDGNPGPAELNRLIRCRGDRITSVNEETCLGKPFADIVQMLVKASKSPNNGVCKLVMQDWRSVHYQL